MNSLTKDLNIAITSITQSWKTAKRKADKQDRVSYRSLDRMRHAPARTTVRDAAFEVMEEAYNKASSNGKYYANARQVMYKARPDILRKTNERAFSDVYFTQTLLKDYIEEFGCHDWRIVWDARGHITEPYTNTVIGLGGYEILKYTQGWTDGVNISAPVIESLIHTSGPANRYNNALFIEKEGFMEILKDAQIPEKYSMALMSTKGIPVKAACDLIKGLYSKNVRVFVLHDFDLEGFKILRTLRIGTRLSSGSDVTDLGLRMADIKGLDYEPVHYGRNRSNPKRYLRECGCTEDEVSFIGSGLRVEINAMTSEELIIWLENKFVEHGVQKLIPTQEIVEKAYRRSIFLKRIQEHIENVSADLKKDNIKIPSNLYITVQTAMENGGTQSWDQVVWRHVKGMEV